LSRRFLNIVAIPLITFLLFVFECSDPQYYIYELLWSFCISFILWHGNGLIITLLDYYVPWRQPAAPRVFVQIGLSVLLTAWVTYFAVKFLYSTVYEVHFGSLVFRKTLFLFLIISLLYNAIYTGLHFFKQWRLSIVHAEELKHQNLVSQYGALKDQINPHFLFNSLNTLIGLIDENAELAKDYGRHFAKIYRYILDKGQQELLTLREELGIISIQKELLRSRFGESLRIEVKTDENLHNKLIPPLTLQMLLENAIKHNKISSQSPLVIEIVTSNHQTLVVKNNIQRKNIQEVSTQLGIKNITKRYEFLTDRKVSITDDNNFYTVELPLLDKKEK